MDKDEKKEEHIRGAARGEEIPTPSKIMHCFSPFFSFFLFFFFFVEMHFQF